MENMQYPAPKQEYKVMVQCCTYNQSQYIEDALKGFAMQQTNFPFICCVFDDASTDGEQEVLKSWINSHCDLEHVEVYDHPLTMIHMAPDKNNSNCIYAIHLQKVNTWGNPEKREMIAYWEKQCEYIAICEGDDYWTDPLKLQKQVDFLDVNPEYSFTAHRCMVFDETLNKWSEYNDVSDYKKKSDGIVIDFKYNKYITHTATLLFRIEALSEYLKFVNNGGPGYDFILIYFLKKAGKGFCFNHKMSVYRLNVGGVYGKQSVNIKLYQGYNALKKLHYTENKSITRKLYYSRYASLFIVSKGMILFQEDFEIFKVLSIGYFLPLKLFRLLKRKFSSLVSCYC